MSTETFFTYTREWAWFIFTFSSMTTLYIKIKTFINIYTAVIACISYTIKEKDYIINYKKTSLMSLMILPVPVQLHVYSFIPSTHWPLFWHFCKLLFSKQSSIFCSHRLPLKPTGHWQNGDSYKLLLHYVFIPII